MIPCNFIYYYCLISLLTTLSLCCVLQVWPVGDQLCVYTDGNSNLDVPGCWVWFGSCWEPGAGFGDGQLQHCTDKVKTSGPSSVDNHSFCGTDITFYSYCDNFIVKIHLAPIKSVDFLMFLLFYNKFTVHRARNFDTDWHWVISNPDFTIPVVTIILGRAIIK